LKNKLPYILFFILLTWHVIIYAQDRFPRPEFESEYTHPEQQLSSPRHPAWEYIDTGILVIALAITTWLALKKRSRQGLVWMSLFSLAYFGFYRGGCICSVGSVQNVALALFNNGYSIPLSVLMFFIIPLVFALLYGRVFCAGVCPLGAIQELTGLRPIRLPANVEATLAMIPFVYLALAVLFASTNSQFIICRYDPFVGIFRLDAPYTMIIFGVLLLLVGIFINRPYCRYLCPYGVLLNICSRFAGRHLTITPAECTNCRLCEEACPYDAIIPSDNGSSIENTSKSRKKFAIYFLMIPVLAAAGALTVFMLSSQLAGVHSNVRLAKEIRLENETGIAAISNAAVAFKESGKTEDELFTDEINTINRYRKATPWAGIFIGLSLGIGLFSLTIRNGRTEYKPHQGKCFSCGRCFTYCPVKPKPESEYET